MRGHSWVFGATVGRRGRMELADEKVIPPRRPRASLGQHTEDVHIQRMFTYRGGSRLFGANWIRLAGRAVELALAAFHLAAPVEFWGSMKLMQIPSLRTPIFSQTEKRLFGCAIPVFGVVHLSGGG